MQRGERPITDLPKPLLIGFCLVFTIQLVLHQQSDDQGSRQYTPLTPPFDVAIYDALSMGSKKLLSYLVVMRLQLHDNQAGQHVRYSYIDYNRLVDWLSLVDRLNPDSEYSTMLASRVYSQTQDKVRLRILLEYIDKAFLANPQLNWRRQAESSVIAKHQLGDLPLALRMAEKLANQPESILMPRWARDIQFLLLAELNEFESAIVIIQSLLKDQSITDNDERRFLKEKLLGFQQKLSGLKQME